MDLSEAATPLRSHPTVSALFTRPLRPGVRSWPPAESVAGSPVDGVMGQAGRIEEGRLLQAKGRSYTAAALLDDRATAERFHDGVFATVYLSPRHYHRIHAPVAGRVGRARHVPGRLLPVNRPAVRLVDRLFPRNERLICLLEETPLGAMAVVAVGAFNVGRITAAFDDRLVTNRRSARAETRVYHPPVAVERGDEIMTFHLGSTVVLLFEPNVELQVPSPGTEIRLGDPLTASPSTLAAER